MLDGRNNTPTDAASSHAGLALTTGNVTSVWLLPLERCFGSKGHVGRFAATSSRFAEDCRG